MRFLESRRGGHRRNKIEGVRCLHQNGRARQAVAAMQMREGHHQVPWNAAQGLQRFDERARQLEGGAQGKQKQETIRVSHALYHLGLICLESCHV